MKRIKKMWELNRQIKKIQRLTRPMKAVQSKQKKKNNIFSLKIELNRMGFSMIDILFKQMIITF